MSKFTMADVRALRALTMSMDEYEASGEMRSIGWQIHKLRESRLADRLEAEVTGKMPERFHVEHWRDRWERFAGAHEERLRLWAQSWMGI